MLPLRGALLEGTEASVSVFVIDRLPIDAADLVLAVFNVHLRILVEGHAHHLVNAHGSVVPLNFIYSDVIRAGFVFRARGRRNGQSSKEHKGTKDCKLTLLFHGTLQREIECGGSLHQERQEYGRLLKALRVPAPTPANRTRIRRIRNPVTD